MIYSRKIKWKLLLSITGNEYQKNLFRTGIKASPGIEQRKTEKKKRNELLNPPNVLTTKDPLLEDATITMPEMAQLLGTTRSAVYTILDNPKYSHFFEFIVIAEKKRITKESFQKFLEGQDRYKLDPSNDYEELAQEQNIALANFRRKKLSQTGIRGSNGNIKYLTFDEASYLAKVSRSMINKWADKGKFTVIKVGSRVRIRRDEFEDWMEQRDLERSMQ